MASTPPEAAVFVTDPASPPPGPEVPRAGARDLPFEAAAAAGGDVAAERVLTLGVAGRLEEGLALAGGELAAEPEHAALHAARAALLYALGRPEAADAAGQRALELAPGSLQSLRQRCEYRAAEGLWEGAMEVCEEYLDRRPEDPQAHLILGLEADRSARSELAIASYERAIALAPGDPRPRNNLVELLGERVYVSHYHEERPHQGLSGRFVSASSRSQGDGRLVRRERLGGLLDHYYREAA